MMSWMRVLLLAALPALGGCVALVAGSAPPSASLVGHEWTVVRVAGAAPASGAGATLRFGGDGRVSGSSFCNRYTGRYVRDGSSLRISGIAVTKMACEGRVMDDEQRMLASLRGTTRYMLTGDGLTLYTGTAASLEARRAR